MNGIMVDNWSTHEIVTDLYNHDKEISENYGKLLSAVLLWDELYYPHNERSLLWQIMKKIKADTLLKPIDDESHLFDKEAKSVYLEHYQNDESSIVAKEAIRYLLLSNFKGLDYFPSSDRATFLNKYNPQNIVSKLDRFDFVRIIDKEIVDYFTEYNSVFGRNVFEIKRPVLVDYIIQNTPKEMTYFEFAMQLRNERSIVQYRDYLSKLEIALENREWKILNELLCISKEIVNDVAKLDKTSIGTIGVSVSPLPSLSFSKEVTINRRKIQLTFLEQLSKFAFNGRKIN